MASACNLRFAGDSQQYTFGLINLLNFKFKEAERIDAASGGGPLVSVDEKKRKKCAKGCMRLKEMLEEMAWLQKATFLSRRPVGLADLNVGIESRVLYYRDSCAWDIPKAKTGKMHYHCTECSATIERKCGFQSHLEKHFRSSKRIHAITKDDTGLKKPSYKKDKQVLEEKTVVSRRQLKGYQKEY
eukprot:gene17058-8574_t